jgi:hypothetical protein
MSPKGEFQARMLSLASIVLGAMAVSLAGFPG